MIKQLEKYATSEPKTPAKTRYTETTQKIFYDKDEYSRRDRVRALIDVEDEYSRTKTISMREVVSNAITNGLATEQVQEADNVEKRETQEQQMEGVVTKDDE